jgi:hypothetical protein
MHRPNIDRAKPPAPLRVTFTAVVALAEAGHLAIEHLHGGIARHHLLNDPSLPAIWNGWGLLLLPLLAWFASARAFHRPRTRWRLQPRFMWRAGAAMLAGLALSVAFSTGATGVANALFPCIVLGGIALRGYRAEYVLGFVLGMAWTVGAVLPMLIGGCIALASAVLWRALVPGLGYAVARVRG